MFHLYYTLLYNVYKVYDMLYDTEKQQSAQILHKLTDF